MVTIPYNNSDFAFTLNDLFLQFSTVETDTYFTLKLTVNFYDFYSETAKQKIKNYKIYLFENSAEENIGRKVDRIMGQFQGLSNLELQYKTAVVDLEAKELNILDDSLVETTTLNGIKFIAGILPKLKVLNTALLSVNINASRITPSGFINVSFLLPEGDNIIEIHKNESILQSETIVATIENNVFTKKYKISDYGANPGDVFKFKIKDIEVYKFVVIFPEGMFSNHILYVDEFKMLQSLECTGNFSFPTDYKQTTHKYKRNLVEILEIIETKKINSFKINTGWVLKTDNVTIDTIARSKKAWLFINDIEVIEMVPVAKKLTNIDSDEELYEYDLEFKINRAYDAQNYTL